jgi:hypothetical protein
MNKYEEWRYNSTIPNIGTRWRCGVSFVVKPLYLQGNSPKYPMDS